jgi:LysM repeat protein
VRPDARPLDRHGRRSTHATVPAALAGSLALLMGAAPAQALEPARSGDSGPRPLLTALDRSVLAAAVAHASAEAAPASYTVQPGDTVSAIAARHGLRTADVLAINGLSWSSIIQPGQVLLLVAAPAEAPSAPPAGAPSAPPAAQTPVAGGYVVQGGDTISAIAHKHGVSVDAVFAANGLGSSSIIYPGQTIAIPGPASAAAEVPVIAEVQVPPPAAAPPPAAGTYIVAAGDTIIAIAQIHGIAAQAVLDANGLDGSSVIHPGQTIAIPAAASVQLVAGTAPAIAASTELNGEQIANAQVIIRVGRELGVSDRGVAIALGTAMQESWLLNLDWGDRDSLGLFQQRPSAGWGTPEQVSDPDRSARAFYGGPSDPNGNLTAGLLDIAGWEGMPFADAAQAVQISAHPERYAQWEQPALAWLAAHG